LKYQRQQRYYTIGKVLCKFNLVIDS